MKAKLFVRIFIGVALLAILGTYIGWEKILESFLSFNLAFALLSIFVLIPVFFLSGFNSWLLARAIGYKIKLRNVMAYSIISWAYGLFSPLKIGEFAQVYYLEKENIPAGKGLVILLVDRIITLLFLFIIACITSIYFLGANALPFLFAGILIFSGLFWFFVVSEKGRGLIKKYLLRKYSERLSGFSKTLMFLAKEKKKFFAVNFVVTVLKWTLTVFLMQILFYAAGISPPFWQLFLITCSVKILSFLPISINGLGVDETLSAYLYGLVFISPHIVLVVYLFARIINYLMGIIVLIFKNKILPNLISQDKHSI